MISSLSMQQNIHLFCLSISVCLSVSVYLSVSRFLPVGCRRREGKTTSAVLFFVSGILDGGRTVEMRRSGQCLFLLGCFNSVQFQCGVSSFLDLMPQRILFLNCLV